MNDDLKKWNTRKVRPYSDGLGVGSFPSDAWNQADAVLGAMGANMKAVRESKGVSVALLAKWSGVSYDSIRKSENYCVYPRLDTVVRLASALNTSLDEYIGMPKKQYESKRPVGYWIMHDDEILGLSYECSACHIETCGDSPYCPRCGTKMEGKK